MKKFLLLAFTVCIGLFSFAQEAAYIPGELLIKPYNKAKISSIIHRNQYLNGLRTELRAVEKISEPMNVWLLKFSSDVDHKLILEALRTDGGVELAQSNHVISNRETEPDDTLFDEQWQYINDGSNGGVEDADIDADQAWDIATGGLTVLGDTIVVAIIDDGIDLNHGDFGDNLWVNHAEIPNNNIDDDNNGYVDDYLGWNAGQNNDNVSGGGHGTPVAGIVGAQGNNANGVSGVNWDVKLMIIRNGGISEAGVIAGYSYPLLARKKYNETNGEEGAFVVSTNSSWGIDFGQPEDAPIWCAFYDTMGVAGILSCGATINGNVNIDEEGDLPTGCSSEYMISVTNMNRTDNKVTQAGYGPVGVDLGAFGAQTYTTSAGGGYGGFGGTSGATPHVAGAIALLYSAPCSDLAETAKADPELAAQLARDYIFNGVDPNASLEGITTQEGRLNLFNSLSLVMQDCGACNSPFNITATEITDSTLVLEFQEGGMVNFTNIRFREIGAMNWNTVMNAMSPVGFEGLDFCNSYEFQFESYCEGDSSGFSESLIITTSGCCEASPLVNAELLVDSVYISWDEVETSDEYEIWIASETDTILVSGILDNYYATSELEECTEYDIILRVYCDFDSIAYETATSFTTKGCGACLDVNYCENPGGDSDAEWIESIFVGPLFNESGNNGGYAEFTDLNPELIIGDNYNFILMPGFQGGSYSEYWKIWIDLDQDGEFENNDELVFDPEVSSNQTVIGNIEIPESALSGNTRMRIAMMFSYNGGGPEPCEEFQFGELEDYCIVLRAEGLCDIPLELDTSDITETSAVITWEDFTDDHIDHTLRIKKTSEVEWVYHYNIESPFVITDLERCERYEFQISANCADGISTSEWTNSFQLNTQCLTATSDISESLSLTISPNPFTNDFNVSLSLDKGQEIVMSILDISGKMIEERRLTLNAGSNMLKVNNLNSVPNGMYLIKLQTEDGIAVKRVVKS